MSQAERQQCSYLAGEGVPPEIKRERDAASSRLTLLRASVDLRPTPHSLPRSILEPSGSCGPASSQVSQNLSPLPLKAATIEPQKPEPPGSAKTHSVKAYRKTAIRTLLELNVERA